MGFLKDNKDRWFGQFDAECLEQSEPYDIWIDAQLQTIDEIMESGANMRQLISVDDIPDDLLQHISSLVGWRQTDYQFNFLTFRDLVKSIVRIYKIKGRLLAYDTFFRAVGYLPTVTELWWDRNSNLVDTKPIGAPDPAKSTRVLNKSNWLQIELDLQFNDPRFPEPLTDGEFSRILFEYLKFLKPVHIKYRPILINVPGFREDVVVLEDALPVIILGDFNSPPGVGFDGLFEDHLEGDILDEVQIYGFFDTEDVPQAFYNNRLRWGLRVARSIELNGVQFPVHVINRNPFTFGSPSPIPDEFRIVVQTTLDLPEEKLELRYNNFTRYNGQTTFAMDKKIEIDDAFKFDSQGYSFGFGADFGVSPTSGDPFFDIEANHPGTMELIP